MESGRSNNSGFSPDNGNATIATTSSPGDVATECVFSDVVQTTPSLDETSEGMWHLLI